MWRELGRAYPRSRGATGATVAAGTGYLGLSPLARGNPTTSAVAVGDQGPIPARAGQPTDQWQYTALRWAYPRSRGATPDAFISAP